MSFLSGGLWADGDDDSKNLIFFFLTIIFGRVRFFRIDS